MEGLADFATIAVCGAGLRLGGTPADGPSPHAVPSSGSSCFYEVELLSGGVVQIGWAAPAFSVAMAARAATATAASSSSSLELEDGDGVGDHEASWAYDGSRGLKWNVESEAYGQGRVWEAGDLVGCSAEVVPSPTGASSGAVVRMTYFLNGENLGIAFEVPVGELLPAAPSSVARQPILLFPCVSLEAGELIRVNLGKAGLAYPPPSSSAGGGSGSGVHSAWDSRCVDGAPLDPAQRAGAGLPGDDELLLLQQIQLAHGTAGVVTGGGDERAAAVKESATEKEAAPAAVEAAASTRHPRLTSPPQQQQPPAVSTVGSLSPGASAEQQQQQQPIAEAGGDADVAPQAPQPAGPLDLDTVDCVAGIEALGYSLVDLKRELAARGLKCG